MPLRERTLLGRALGVGVAGGRHKLLEDATAAHDGELLLCARVGACGGHTHHSRNRPCCWCPTIPCTRLDMLAGTPAVRAAMRLLVQTPTIPCARLDMLSGTQAVRAAIRAELTSG